MVSASIEDPDGRQVELTDEHWSRIVRRRPEVAGCDVRVLRAVAAPDRRMFGRFPSEEWFYLKARGPGQWLTVIVAYARERGYIVDAARRSIP